MLLKGKSVGDLREELVPISHNRCSTKTCENILNAVAGDKVKDNDYQDARDVVTLGIVSDLQHYDSQLKEVDKQLEISKKLCLRLEITIGVRFRIVVDLKNFKGLTAKHMKAYYNVKK